MHPRAQFICFEGIDGSGKSTQVGHLAAALAAPNTEIVQTKEPYDEAISDLLHRASGTYDPAAQLFLFCASRVQHCERLVKPALARGAIVLSDRWGDSTLAYQGYGLGLDVAFVEAQNNLATGGLEPDIIFLMDIKPEVMLERVRGRGAALSSYEQRGLDFFERVRAGYLTIAERKPSYRVIDASQGELEIAAQIRAHF